MVVDIFVKIIGFVMYAGMFLGWFAAILLIMGYLMSSEKEIMIAFMISLLVAVPCTWILSYSSNQLTKQRWHRPEPYVVHSIVALQDGNEINGSVRRSGKYSMSGYINEEFMYVYEYKVHNGGMKIQKVSAKNATVFFNDNVNPNAKWYKEERSFWWYHEERYTCDIFIPTGSMQSEILLDLQ